MVTMNIKPCRLFKWQILTKSQFKLCFDILFLLRLKHEVVLTKWYVLIFLINNWETYICILRQECIQASRLQN